MADESSKNPKTTEAPPGSKGGESFASKGPGGRPSKLTPELIEKALGFLGWMEGQKITKVVYTKDGRQEIESPRPPTVNLFSEYLNLSRDTVYRWAKENSQFSDILGEVQRKYEQVLIENGLNDRYNANLAKFLLSADHGKREKSDLTTDGKELPTPIMKLEK